MRVCNLLLSICLLLVVQQFTPDQKKFYEAYKNLVSTSDLRGVNRQVGRDPRTAAVVFQRVLEEYSRTQDSSLLDEIRVLANALDEFEDGTRYQKRLEYVAGLNSDALATRLEIIDRITKANQAYDDARQTKESAQFRRALVEYEDVVTRLEKIKDKEWLAFTRFRLGHCYESLGEYMNCVRAYDQAMDEWIASGRPKDANYNYMVDKRRELIDKGYDPDMTGSEMETNRRDTATSFAPDTEWQSWETEYETMRKYDEFSTPSPFATEHFLLWRTFTYMEGKPSLIGYPTPNRACEPFGVQLQFVRDGSKGFVDTDGDGKGDVEAKMLANKPTNVRIPSGEGRDADEYHMFFCTGSSNENWLGRTINYASAGYFRTGCYREAEILDEDFILIDDNCSGALGDYREERDGMLRNNPVFYDCDAMIIGRGKNAVPFSEFAKFGDKFYRIKVNDTFGKTIRTREMDIDTGYAKLEWEGPEEPTSLVIRETREFQGAFFDIAGSDPVEVPVGRYEIAVGKIEDGAKKSMKQAWIFKGNAKTFEVKKGETTTLEMGEPYTFSFKTDDKGEILVVEGDSQLIHDRSGALIGRLFPDPAYPEVEAQTLDGDTIARKAEMRPLSLEDYNEKPWMAFLPADLEIEKPEDAEVEVKFYLKKHDLIGGPIESDWQ